MWLLSGPQHRGAIAMATLPIETTVSTIGCRAAFGEPLGMPEQVLGRRVAPILAGDVVGCSRLMQAGEDDACAALKARRKAIVPTLVEGSISRYSTGARS